MSSKAKQQNKEETTEAAETTEKITVHKGKKEVSVVSFGAEPLFVDAKGRVIPNGFKVETYVSGFLFHASTKVELEENKVKYCFALKEDASVHSGWKKSPTGALDAINKILDNKRHKMGTNGQLMIGVTYDPVQARIKQVFANEIPNLRQTVGFNLPSRKRKVTEEEDESALALVRLSRQRRSPTGERREPTFSLPAVTTAATTPTKRVRMTPKTSSNSDRIVDERSMQPIKSTKEPTATPSKMRNDSYGEWDDMALSSQQSLDLAGLDVNSQEARERFADKFMSSQDSEMYRPHQLREASLKNFEKFSDRLMCSQESELFRPAQRESSLTSLLDKNSITSLIDEKTNSSQLSNSSNGGMFGRDGSLITVSSLLKEHSILTMPREGSLPLECGMSLKLSRSDTQTTDPILVDENSLAWLPPSGFSSQ